MGNGKGEGEKDLLRSGVEYCGTCLNGVREIIGYCGTWLEGVRVVMEVLLRYLARGARGIIVNCATWLRRRRGCNLGRRGCGLGST